MALTRCLALAVFHDAANCALTRGFGLCAKKGVAADRALGDQGGAHTFISDLSTTGAGIAAHEDHTETYETG